MKISILKQVAGLFFINIMRSVLRDSSGQIEHSVYSHISSSFPGSLVVSSSHENMKMSIGQVISDSLK